MLRLPSNSHIVMFTLPNDVGPQPSYGIRLVCSGEVVIGNGTDLVNMGNCLDVVPGIFNGSGTYPDKIVGLIVSDSLFDSGTAQGCVNIHPTGNSYVSTARFSNVWASTHLNPNPNHTNGFTFVGSGGVQQAPRAVQDVSLVNCQSKGFAGGQGLYASGVNALSVVGSTFSGNQNGIFIDANMNNFVLSANKCGNYTVSGPNTGVGIFINSSCTGYISTGNICYGNTGGAYIPGPTSVPGSIFIGNNLP